MATPSFGPGTRLHDRYVIRAQLGAGAFGTVYSADDTATGQTVAIKHLTFVTGATIYRFKNEFRSLADREHPNLVRFLELFTAGDDWFFSMELVEGVRFDRYVTGASARAVLEAPTTPATPATVAAALPPMPTADLERLNATLPQLVAAIRALHAAGIVHRDLKPANVLVTPAGRVVVLDFGLSTAIDADAQKSALGIVMGTPTYMAPEQALGRATTEPADWYALGVMLYEVLYGRPRFTGTSHDMVTAKLSPGTLPWPAPLPGAEDFDALCWALLSAEPGARPTGEEITAWLEARPAAPAAPARAVQGPLFVGREPELAALHRALQNTETKGIVVARVRGESGVGKSALVRAFVATAPGDLVALQGRCYERESMPYKTLDGVVDSLTRYLLRLPSEEASVLVPREVPALRRLFPVFGRLRLFAEAPERRRSSSPIEERRRGFAALFELLGRIGDRCRLIVTIDDLQWGDLDSVAPLVELLTGTDPPRLLLVLAHRSNDEPRSVALLALAEALDKHPELKPIEVTVGPLAPEDAVALAQQLLPEAQRSRAEAVARESGGIPFLVPELARASAHDGSAAISLEHVLTRRVATLSPAARRLLEVVAVAGRPVTRTVAFTAAGLEERDRLSAREELSREQLVRSAADAQEEALECYHDRIREGVVASLDSEHKRATHAALATALVAAEAAAPEALAEHFRLAGRLAEARPIAVRAAERATHALAFERAVALYRVAQQGAESEERRLLTSKLADVLAYAGRGREAADAYLEAAKGLAVREARVLRRKAAEQLLRGGSIDAGMALGRELLLESGLSYPEGRGALLFGVATQRVLLSLRGLDFVERQLGEGDVDARDRVDLLFSICSCLRTIDILRGAELQTRQVREALALGEPSRVALGLVLVATSMGVEGRFVDAERLANRAKEIAHRIDHPYAIGSSHGAFAALNWFQGRWRRSLEDVEALEAVLRERSPQHVWELTAPEIFVSLRSFFALGELQEAAALAHKIATSARERGDTVSLAAVQSIGVSRIHLVLGNLAEARRTGADGLARHAGGDWHLMHQEGLRAELTCDLYEGDGAKALARVAETMPKVRASLLLRSLPERVMSYTLYGNAALLAGDAAAAARWAKQLGAAKGHSWAEAHAAALRAGVSALQGRSTAAPEYADAARKFDALEMPLYAAAARRRQGQVEGGSHGATLAERSEAALKERGVSAPAAYARTLVG